MNEQELLAQIEKLLRDGKSEEEVRAWVATQMAKPSLPGIKPDAGVFTGRTPEQAKDEPLRIAGIPAKSLAKFTAGMLAGGGVGGLTAEALAAKVGSKLAGRLLTGAVSGVTGGAAARAVTGDKILDPVAAAIDMTLGGAAGGVFGGVRGAEKEAAKRLGKVLPRTAQRGVPMDVGKAGRVPVMDPALRLEQMAGQIKLADQARFDPIWKKFPNMITDQGVLDQWDAIVRNIPSALDDMLMQKDIAMEPMGDLIKLIKSGSGNDIEYPTLQGVQRLKEALDAAIKGMESGITPLKEGSGKAAASMRSLLKAKEQLKGLAIDRVPGGAEYAAALAESSADKAAMSAMREGEYSLQGAANPANPHPVSPERVAQQVDEYAQAPKPSTVETPLQAFREGQVGMLANNSDPLSKLNDPMVARKITEGLGLPSAGVLDEAVAPWEKVGETVRHLQRTGDVGLAGQFGLATTLGGGMGGVKPAAGSVLLSGIRRKLALQSAKNLEGTVGRVGGTDLDDYRRIFAELAMAKMQRAARLGKPIGGTLGAAYGSGVGRPKQ